jgi:hypothetical protein
MCVYRALAHREQLVKRASKMKLRSGKAINELNIEVKTLAGKTYMILCSPDDTMTSVMNQIESLTNVPVSHQRIFYRGQQYWSCDLNKTLLELGSPTKLSLILRLLCTCCSK